MMRRRFYNKSLLQIKMALLCMVLLSKPAVSNTQIPESDLLDLVLLALVPVIAIQERVNNPGDRFVEGNSALKRAEQNSDSRKHPESSYYAFVSNEPAPLRDQRIQVIATMPLEDGFSSSIVQLPDEHVGALKELSSLMEEWGQADESVKSGEALLQRVKQFLTFSDPVVPDSVTWLYPLDLPETEESTLATIREFMLPHNRGHRSFRFTDGSLLTIYLGSEKVIEIKKNGLHVKDLTPCSHSVTTLVDTCMCNRDKKAQAASASVKRCFACEYVHFMKNEDPGMDLPYVKRKDVVFRDRNKEGRRYRKDKDDDDDDWGAGLEGAFARNLRKKMF